jgi:gas vesicle protein
MSRRHDEDHGWTFLTGLTLGLAGGVAAALFYAPESGRDLRARVAGRARQSRDRVSAAVEQSRSALHAGLETIERGRNRVSAAVEEGRETYRQVSKSGV